MYFKIIQKITHILIIVLVILHNAQTGTDNEVDPKIIGGIPVKDGQAKFMVSICGRLFKDIGTEHLCGGSLISDTKILTAAHCFFKLDDEKDIFSWDPSLFYVTMGSIYMFNNNSKALTFNISYYVYHKNYDTKWHRNDIALVIFKRINLSKYPNIGIIMLTDRKVKPEENGTHYGWGQTTRKPFSTIMRQINVSVIDYEKCAKSYSLELTFVFPNEFCAGTWTGGKDACFGDSGGPLVSDGKVVGIVSRGHECALAKFPTIYEDVFEYKSWIEHDYKHLGKYGNSEIVKMNNFLVVYIIFLWIFIYINLM